MDPMEQLTAYQTTSPSQGVLGHALTPGGMPGLQMAANPQEQAVNTSRWGQFFDRLQTDENLQLQALAFFSGIAKPAPNVWAGLSQGVENAVNTRLALRASDQEYQLAQAKIGEAARKSAVAEADRATRLGLALKNDRRQDASAERQEEAADALGAWRESLKERWRTKDAEAEKAAAEVQKSRDYQRRKDALDFYNDLMLASVEGTAAQREAAAKEKAIQAFPEQRDLFLNMRPDPWSPAPGVTLRVGEVFTGPNGKRGLYEGMTVKDGKYVPKLTPLPDLPDSSETPARSPLKGR